MTNDSLRLLSQVSMVLWMNRTSWYAFVYLKHSCSLIFHTFSDVSGPQLFQWNIYQQASPGSQTGEELYKSHHYDKVQCSLRIRKCPRPLQLIPISQLNHFAFAPALLFPFLRLNLSLSIRLQGLGTDGLVSFFSDRVSLLYFIGLLSLAELPPLARGIKTLSWFAARTPF